MPISQSFPQFIVIHTVKGLGIVNKAEIYVFLELSCFFDDPANVGNLISKDFKKKGEKKKKKKKPGIACWEAET